jgi:hypothetical protein
MADDANLEGARVAISHEWLVSIGGSERCVAIFSRLFPNALIYTSIHKPEITGGLDPRERVRASFVIPSQPASAPVDPHAECVRVVQAS